MFLDYSPTNQNSIDYTPTLYSFLALIEFSIRHLNYSLFKKIKLCCIEN